MNLGRGLSLNLQESETWRFRSPLRVGGLQWTPTPLLPTGTHGDLPKWPRVGLRAVLVQPCEHCGPDGETGSSRDLGQQGEKQMPSFPVLHLTSREPPVMTSLEATLDQGSTHSPPSPGKPGNSSTGPCLPEIHRSPVPGGLELLCEAACGPGVAVRWTQAPGDLEAYERREAGAQAWLSVLWAACNPEGWFQCRLDPGGQMASLYVIPEICEFGRLGRMLGEPEREGNLESRP